MIFDKFYVGESKSKYDQNGFDDTSNLDVYTEPGSARCNSGLSTFSTTPNEPCVIEQSAKGTMYCFSKTTSKIWKGNPNSDTFSLAITVPAPYSYSCVGARDFNGAMYFWSTSSLSKYEYGASLSISIADPCVITKTAHGLVDGTAIAIISSGSLPTGITSGTIYYSRSTGTNTFNIYDTQAHAIAGGATGRIATSGSQSGTHTMFTLGIGDFNDASGASVTQNLSLFIAAGSNVASVDNAGTFSANVLDLETSWIITSLAGVGTDILIGTRPRVQAKRCKVFLWDTYSSSYTLEDEVFETSIHYFVPSDNTVFAMCGMGGQLYYWTGSSLEKFMQARIAPDLFLDTEPGPYFATNVAGRPYFAAGNKIYSLSRVDKDFPYAIVEEFSLSSGTLASIYAYTGTWNTNDMFVSDGSKILTTDATNKQVAYLDTPEAMGDFQKVVVQYDSLPANTSIGISTKVDSAANYTAQTTITDTVRKKVYFDGGLGTVNWLQARITLTPNGSNTPIIKSISFE